MIIFTIIMIVLVSSLLRPRPIFWGRPFFYGRPMFMHRHMRGPRMGGPHMRMHCGPRRFY